MAYGLRKWILRLIATTIFIAGLLIAIVLNPVFTYAGKARYNKYSIFHNKPFDPTLQTRLSEANALLNKSELYDPALRLQLCLNDGSIYPDLIQRIQGPAFAYGFYDKVVLMGNTDAKANYVELNGFKWNLTQLLAHEMTHCYQFNKRGLLRSRPIARIPTWKWEGYPEYIARQNKDQKDLMTNIQHLLRTEQIDNDNWIYFADSTGTVIPYYKSWLLVKFCIDIKRMSYEQILNDTIHEKTTEQEMMDWYLNKVSKY